MDEIEPFVFPDFGFEVQYDMQMTDKYMDLSEQSSALNLIGAYVNDGVPRDDGMQAVMAEGEEPQNQSDISNVLQTKRFSTLKVVPRDPDFNDGINSEGNQTQPNDYIGERIVGDFKHLMVMANPPPSSLQTPEHDGCIMSSTSRGLTSTHTNEYIDESTIEDTYYPEEIPAGQIQISQLAVATASYAEQSRSDHSTRVELPQQHMAYPADKEERLKMKNKQASGKSRENTKNRHDRLLRDMNCLEEKIDSLELQHRILQGRHENALVSAGQRDKCISIGAYLEEYAELVMPLALITSPENLNRDGNPALVNQGDTRLEVPIVPQAPKRLTSHRQPRSRNVKATEGKHSNAAASKRYRDQENKYWGEIDKRTNDLKEKLNVLKHNIRFFQKCERQSVSENELRKSILGRQFAGLMPFDQLTKFSMAGWFYKVYLTKNELDSLGVENRHFKPPGSLGFFHFIVSSRQGENIMVLDFTPYLPKLSDVPPS